MPSGSASAETEHAGAGTLFVYASHNALSASRRSRASPSPNPGPSGSRSSPTRGAGGGGGVVARARERSRVRVAQRSKERQERKERQGSPFSVVNEYMDWDEILKIREEPRPVASLDSLLSRGIAEYTFYPASSGGVLGKGKFSTVYKVLSADGEYYALKHTPLYPHHPLISARLLREPTLLSELPTHPCLIGVNGWVRTEGHFYLIEDYASHHVPLPNHPLPLSPSRAAYILDQLVSVVRDCLHDKGRVCHRDLKGDNVLVDIDTGDIVILDLGLATRFSASEPKLTTCCGSPAFHSPEIVLALSRPPGEITYYGPELDIWCIGLVVLSLLLQVRFPLGPKHTSPYIMRERVMDRLQELDALYPPHAPWRNRQTPSVSAAGAEHEKREWRRVRRALATFLDIDSRRRMAAFRSYEIGDKTVARLRHWDETSVSQLDTGGNGNGNDGEGQKRKFKQTNFMPAQVKYTLPIYLDIDESDESEHDATGNGNGSDNPRTRTLVLHNTSNESERRITSYIKYLLRCAGILYHVLPTSSTPFLPTSTQESETTLSTPSRILQLVLPVPDTPPKTASGPGSQAHSQSQLQAQSTSSWFPNIFNLSRKGGAPLTPDPALTTAAPATSPRSASVPPRSGRQHRSPSPLPGHVPLSRPNSGGKKALDKVLRCWIKIDFDTKHTLSPDFSDGNNDGRLGRAKPRYSRQGSTETFTSFREGLGLSPIVPLNPGSTTSTATTTATATTLRSASATRTRTTSGPAPDRQTPAGLPSRPGTRRTVSHNRVGGWAPVSISNAPATSLGVGGVGSTSPRTRATTSLTPITTTVSNAGSGGSTGAASGSGSGGSAHGSGGSGDARNTASVQVQVQTTIPFSPLSRQVSLSSSPATSTSSRAPSRASSRSRVTSGPYPLTPSMAQQHPTTLHQLHHSNTPYHTHSHQPHAHAHNHSHSSRVVITLSDPRAYSVLRKALDQVQPGSGTVLLHNANIGTGHDSPLLLSPLTIRRSSLAPSLGSASASASHIKELDHDNDADLEINVDIDINEDDDGRVGEVRLDVDILRAMEKLDLNRQFSSARAHTHGQEEIPIPEEEEERGRPRSKEDPSSVYYHLQKVHHQLNRISPTDTLTSTPTTPTLLNVDLPLSPSLTSSAHQRERESSRPRGLLDVLFGRNVENKDKAQNHAHVKGNGNSRSISMPPPRSVLDQSA